MGSSRNRSREPRVTVVIPALNEARNLAQVLPSLPSVHEVIVVDGYSPDDTHRTVRRVLPSARVICQTRYGKGNALVCGFAAATGDVIVMFDADGSADPTEIPRFVAALRDGADFAKGSRVRPGGGSDDLTRLRDLGNRALTVLTNLLFRTRYSDLCYGYNAFWADVLPRLRLPEPDPPGTAVWGDGFEIETVLNCRAAAARLAVREVPSHERRRIHGVSNLHAVRDGVRVLRTILTEWRWRPTTRDGHDDRSYQFAG
ncbi:glycosyltransferase family 2 protein [Micromonospora sp. CA-263727]|uniref:glycosyltransferase family 2 protein n=1 Tax=Micromonospora sp. CA-263727 TaxID=3239967 RepID=UPI003D8C2D66